MEETKINEFMRKNKTLTMFLFGMLLIGGVLAGVSLENSIDDLDMKEFINVKDYAIANNYKYDNFTTIDDFAEGIMDTRPMLILHEDGTVETILLQGLRKNKINDKIGLDIYTCDDNVSITSQVCESVSKDNLVCYYRSKNQTCADYNINSEWVYERPYGEQERVDI